MAKSEKAKFDNEIRQAQTPDGDASGPSTRQSAKSGANSPSTKTMPPAKSSQTHVASDPIAHAAGIAHAILQHGRG